MGKWSEVLHPRGKGGKFKGKGGGGGKKNVSGKFTSSKGSELRSENKGLRKDARVKGREIASQSRANKKAKNAKVRATVANQKAARAQYKATHKRVLTKQGKRVLIGAGLGNVPGAIIAAHTGANKGKALTKTVKRTTKAKKK